jgi:hypothetical protein
VASKAPESYRKRRRDVRMFLSLWPSILTHPAYAVPVNNV